MNKNWSKKENILAVLNKFQKDCIEISRYDVKRMGELKKIFEELEMFRKEKPNAQENGFIEGSAKKLAHYMGLYEEGNDIIKPYIGLTGISYTKLLKKSLLGYK